MSALFEAAAKVKTVAGDEKGGALVVLAIGDATVKLTMTPELAAQWMPFSGKGVKVRLEAFMAPAQQAELTPAKEKKKKPAKADRHEGKPHPAFIMGRCVACGEVEPQDCAHGYHLFEGGRCSREGCGKTEAEAAEQAKAYEAEQAAAAKAYAAERGAA